jgi:predicted GIY-YIG superfamily endonuclease
MVIVYALKSDSTTKLYVGMTTDIKQRLKEHNSGKSKFTSAFVPWIVIYQEEVADFKQGRIREKYLKSTAGKKFIKKILEESQGSLPA